MPIHQDALRNLFHFYVFPVDGAGAPGILFQLTIRFEKGCLSEVCSDKLKPVLFVCPLRQTFIMLTLSLLLWLISNHSP